MILQIGEWVLRTACREAATWPRPLIVAVNVSAVQLHSRAIRRIWCMRSCCRPVCRRIAWSSRSPRRRWSAT